MLPTVARQPENLDSRAAKSSRRAHPGLTSIQARTLDHITHCPACGAWEVVTDRELRVRCETGFVAAAWCRHFIGDAK